MNSQTPVDEILTAFADVPRPENGILSTTVDAANAIETKDDMLFSSAEETKYYLPRLMCLAITMPEVEVRDPLLVRLACFLNVDFSDPPGLPPEMSECVREGKRQRFSSYTNAQSRAIHNWYAYVEEHFDAAIFEDSVEPGMKYWKARSGSS